jgi:hypothetical protein
MSDLFIVEGDQDGTFLSKEQEAFNKKIREIKSLKKTLEELSSAIKTAQVEFQKTVIPLQNDFIGLMKERLRILSEYYWNVKLSKSLKRDLLDVLILECDQILRAKGNDDEVSKWLEEFENQKNADVSEVDRNAEKEREKEVEDAFQDFFDDFLGGDEGEGAWEDRSQQDKGHKKKAAKQAAKEEARKRSIKEIYRDLIKVFHPDKEMDETAKKKKEEISKEITEAYKKNDLLTLLEFESSLVVEDKGRIREMADDKLKVYNEVLTEQKKDLEYKLYALKMNNETIYRGMCMKNSNGKKFLKKVRDELHERNDALVNQMYIIQNNKKYLKYFVDVYLSRYDPFDDEY